MSVSNPWCHGPGSRGRCVLVSAEPGVKIHPAVSDGDGSDPPDDVACVSKIHLAVPDGDGSVSPDL